MSFIIAYQKSTIEYVKHHRLFDIAYALPWSSSSITLHICTIIAICTFNTATSPLFGKYVIPATFISYPITIAILTGNAEIIMWLSF